MGFSQEFLELVVLGFKLSKLFDDNYVGRLETLTGWVREVGLP